MATLFLKETFAAACGNKLKKNISNFIIYRRIKNQNDFLELMNEKKMQLLKNSEFPNFYKELLFKNLK